jgi:uncharacterized integral membrane protein
MSAYLLGALGFAIAIVVFVVQNDTQVSVQFINWKSSEISLAVVVLISAGLGALISYLLSSYRAFKTGQKLRILVNANRKYEKELLNLKGGKSTSATDETK